MNMERVWMYGLDDSDIIHKDWVYSTMSTQNRKLIANRWATEYGCTRVIEVKDSKELKEAWFDYIKTMFSNNGLNEFMKFELIDFIECEGVNLLKVE